MRKGPIYCPPYTPMVEVVPEGKSGSWSVNHFEIDEKDVKWAQLSGVMNGGAAYREVWDMEPGRYVRLFGPGYCHDPLMSDMPMERRTCLEAVRKAHGRVFVGGLGIGMMLVPLLTSAEVDSVTVVELESDIALLVEPHLRKLPGGEKLDVVLADLMTHEPKEKYDSVWLDIWGDICADNWEPMKELRRRWRSYVRPGGWLGLWRYEDVREKAREDRAFGRRMGDPRVAVRKNARRNAERRCM